MLAMFGTVAVEELDDYSGVARYIQIAKIVEREIRNGTWEVGKPAPSRSQLVGRFGVAGETARRAQAWLSDRGYLVNVPGVGLVVTPADRWHADDD
jgi:DNA-binding GntR family transcriptional regulator